MKSLTKHQKDDGSSRSLEAQRKLFQQKIKSMCLGAECDPRRIKNHGLTLFEAMLSLKQRRASALKEVKAQRQKMVRHRYHSTMIFITQLSVPRIQKRWQRGSKRWRRHINHASQGTSWILGGGQAIVDKLQEVNLGLEDEPQPTFTCGNMSSKKKTTYQILKKNLDVLAWTYSEMMGLDPAIAMQHLAIELEMLSWKKPWGACTQFWLSKLRQRLISW